MFGPYDYNTTLEPYISVEPMPPSPERVERKLLTLKYGDTVELVCDESHAKFPAWQYDHSTLNLTTPIHHSGQSNPAGIHLDILGRLTIADAQVIKEAALALLRCFWLTTIKPLEVHSLIS